MPDGTMDWDVYKALCDRPDHWTRWMLEQCIDLFEQLERAELSALLKDAAASEPLQTPADHTGPPASQVLHVDLDREVREAMLSAIQDAYARGMTTRQTERRGLGGFVEAWREYAAYEPER